MSGGQYSLFVYELQEINGGGPRDRNAFISFAHVVAARWRTSTDASSFGQKGGGGDWALHREGIQSVWDIWLLVSLVNGGERHLSEQTGIRFLEEFLMYHELVASAPRSR